eukprot:scaffold40235_cov49-Cyclotella_meneghiniana.AAC.7
MGGGGRSQLLDSARDMWRIWQAISKEFMVDNSEARTNRWECHETTHRITWSSNTSTTRGRIAEKLSISKLPTEISVFRR